MQNIPRHAIENESREEWALRNKAAYLAPGYVLLVELSSKGGTSNSNYTEKKISRTRSQVIFGREVDDPELDKKAKQALAAVRWKLKRYGALFFAGAYFIDEDVYPEFNKELNQDRHHVQAINDTAAHLESNRVTRVGIFALRADVNDHEIAKRLGGAIYARLTSLREAYTAELRHDYNSRWMDCRNMDMLVAGKQRKILKAALEHSEELTRTHFRAYRKRVKQRDLKAAENIQSDVDYGPIDAAIELFESR